MVKNIIKILMYYSSYNLIKFNKFSDGPNHFENSPVYKHPKYIANQCPYSVNNTGYWNTWHLNNTLHQNYRYNIGKSSFNKTFLKQINKHGIYINAYFVHQNPNKCLLHTECHNPEGKSFFVKHLIKKGALVNLVDGYGNTPIHYTCFTNCKGNIIRILIRNKAKIHLKNNSGKTPIDIIIEKFKEVKYEYEIKRYSKALCTFFIKRNQISYYKKIKDQNEIKKELEKIEPKIKKLQNWWRNHFIELLQ